MGENIAQRSYELNTDSYGWPTYLDGETLRGQEHVGGA